ncbi:hypothetical protein GJ654_13805 [Rhodoblastus acidophilus]|uniref:Uncharacterized protein n=1 Tax=Rhodoblastus acidophilus TaxID=1074 RepID=A0A6N8DSA0_RHOAC|nr:hypothetical protein [Rhodoblastus acidophilus]MCW2275561.1 hypothetical protein [Rhodoblastus acidophilus]MTV32061.1 hypothetical protein [Rhodoblastus acidophilus]
MTTTAIFLPLVLASLFMIVAVHQELANPQLCPRLAPAAKRRMHEPGRAVRVPAFESGPIAALNASDFDRRYSMPPIATCESGADRV